MTPQKLANKGCYGNEKCVLEHLNREHDITYWGKKELDTFLK